MSNLHLKKAQYNNSNYFSFNFKIIFWGLVLLISLSIIAFSVSSTIIGKNKIEYKKVEISNGDTLWKIVQKNYGDQYNLRKIIYKVKKINNMENVILQPGETIKLPEIN